MTLQQLTYFLAAAEPHVVLGGRRLASCSRQPSLSEQIRRLEAELGVALFTRAGRGVELTEAGDCSCRTPSARWPRRGGVESVRQIRELTGGTVTFGFFGGAHHTLLSPLVQDFRTRHPDVRVRAVGQNSAEVADAVRDGQPRGRPRDPARRRPGLEVHASRRSNCCTCPPSPNVYRSR